jgi:hypothetical protein
MINIIQKIFRKNKKKDDVHLLVFSIECSNESNNFALLIGGTVYFDKNSYGVIEKRMKILRLVSFTSLHHLFLFTSSFCI